MKYALALAGIVLTGCPPSRPDDASALPADAAAPATADAATLVDTPRADANFVPTTDGIVINEVLLDATATDSNCDGTANAQQDKFVELVNDSSTTLHLMNMTIEDTTAVRHTFAPGNTGRMDLLPGESIVIWGGGTPTCAGVDNYFVASTGSLGTGDVIRVKSGLTTVAIATLTSPTPGVSMNRSPDIAGPTYVDHDTIAASKLSPGRKADGSSFL